MKTKHKKIQAGDTFNVAGGTASVVEYFGWKDVLIEYNDKHKHRATVRADHLRSGLVKNPFRATLYGVGFLGSGKHLSRVNGKITRAYSAWSGMFDRCYDTKHHARHPTYIGCSVHPDWHNFQNFAEWFHSQANSESSGFHLDKDLIVLGNKVYSSEVCSFVPSHINTILGDSRAARGIYPQGVSVGIRGYMAQVNIFGKVKNLGAYQSQQEAFSVYKKEKEKYVKEVAERYKSQIDQRVFSTLTNWRVSE